MSTDSADGSALPIDTLLGQPRMVADPRISVEHAAVVLGKTRAQVYRLIRLGRLRRRGEPNKPRGLLLSDVLEYRERGDPIKLIDAARLLKTSVANVRRLIDAGELKLVPGSQRLVYPGDVKQLADRWVRPSPSPRQPEGPAGHVNTAAAAAILKLSIARTRQLAGAELIPAVRDAQGRYWYDPERIGMVRRARDAAKSRDPR